jgi:hypothetical protein
MPDEKSGIKDEVFAELNPDPNAGPDPDAKGPDPEQWPVENRTISRRKVDTFVPSGDTPKGPHPDEWPDA